MACITHICTHIYIYIYTHTYIYTYIYVYTYICICILGVHLFITDWTGATDT